MSTTPDRWTCPECNHTETLDVVTTWDRARARLNRVRDDHARVHARRAVTTRTRRERTVSGRR